MAQSVSPELQKIIAEALTDAEGKAPTINISDYKTSLKDMAASAQIDRYGIALMMIREGCDNPQKVAREALAAYGR